MRCNRSLSRVSTPCRLYIVWLQFLFFVLPCHGAIPSLDHFHCTIHQSGHFSFQAQATQNLLCGCYYAETQVLPLFSRSLLIKALSSNIFKRMDSDSACYPQLLRRYSAYTYSTCQTSQIFVTKQL